MNCQKVKEKLSDLLLDPQSVSAETRRHVEECAACRRELDELQATMEFMNEWAAPEVNPFFDAKLLASLRAEQDAGRANVWERTKAWFLYSSSMRMRPLMAGALGLAIVAGGGTYADIAWQHAQQAQQESATVRDLQSLDGNAQVFQQLDAVDQAADQQNQNDGSANGSSSSD